MESRQPKNARVFIGRVKGYDDGAALGGVIARGLAALEVDALGPRIFAKANWVLSHPEVARHSYTRPEVVDAALAVLLDKDPNLRFRFAGNSGANAPTSAQARGAVGEDPRFARRGYYTFERRYPGQVRIQPSDEHRSHRYVLRRGPRLSEADRAIPAWGVDPEKRFWSSIVTDAALADSDAVVLFPKLKTNVLSGGISAAIKLTGIGLLLDHYRLLGHHFHNDRRIADMQEIVRPELIITDAIDCGYGGNQMTQAGRRLGCVIMATNAVAHDSVCAQILNLDPRHVEHIWLSAARDYGPIDNIEIVGDTTLAELQSITGGWGQSGLIPVDQFGTRFLAETDRTFPWEILAGPPRDEAGSCGVLLDWLYMSFDRPEHRKKMAGWPPLSVCAGELEKTPTHPTVVLVGDRACRSFAVQTAATTTLFRLPRFLARFLGAPSRIYRYRLADGRRGTAYELRGDPPSHKDLIIGIAMATRFRARAALLRVDMVLSTYLNMPRTRTLYWWRNRGAMKNVEPETISRSEEKGWLSGALLQGSERP